MNLHYIDEKEARILLENNYFPKIPFLVRIIGEYYAKRHGIPLNEVFRVEKIQYSKERERIELTFKEAIFSFPWCRDSFEILTIKETSFSEFEILSFLKLDSKNNNVILSKKEHLSYLWKRKYTEENGFYCVESNYTDFDAIKVENEILKNENKKLKDLYIKASLELLK